MGCGASNSSSNQNSGSPPNVSNNGNVRGSNTTPVPVQARANLVSRPLTVTANFRYGATITQVDLNRLRSEFWGTRTEGSAMMWQNIRSAAEALISNDLALASAILEASNIITTTGTLEVCYDERGSQYKVPMYCFANPTELVASSSSGSSNSSGAQLQQQQQNSGIPTASAVVGSAVGGAGTAQVVEATPLKLKVRINPGDINMMVNVDAGKSILDLKKSIVEQNIQSAVPIPAMKEDRQRIIFMGRELQNAQVLRDVGVDEQKVVQVFLRS